MINIQRFECNPFQENCYVANDNSGEAVIIDCGAFYDEERKAVTEYIRDNKLRPVHLIATHAHVDHNFGNDTIFKEFGLKPEVSGRDEMLMNHLPEQAMAFCNIQIDRNVIPPVDRFFTEKDVICFGNHKLSILPTPGHTPGSVFFYCKEEHLAFSGDTLFRMSIGRTDFEQGCYTDIIASLHNVVAKLPDDTVILPGHGPQTNIKDELAMNPYIRL